MSERFLSNDSLLILNETRALVIQYDRLIILEENQKKGNRISKLHIHRNQIFHTIHPNYHV
jgi:hypothetical protein